MNTIILIIALQILVVALTGCSQFETKLEEMNRLNFQPPIHPNSKANTAMPRKIVNDLFFNTWSTKSFIQTAPYGCHHPTIGR